jgi:hypothetical protein
MAEPQPRRRLVIGLQIGLANLTRQRLAALVDAARTK